MLKNKKLLDNNNEQKNIKITVEEKPTGEILASAGVGNDGGHVGFLFLKKILWEEELNLYALNLSEERKKVRLQFIILILIIQKNL